MRVFASPHQLFSAHQFENILHSLCIWFCISCVIILSKNNFFSHSLIIQVRHCITLAEFSFLQFFSQICYVAKREDIPGWLNCVEVDCHLFYLDLLL